MLEWPLTAEPDSAGFVQSELPRLISTATHAKTFTAAHLQTSKQCAAFLIRPRWEIQDIAIDPIALALFFRQWPMGGELALMRFGKGQKTILAFSFPKTRSWL